MIFVGTVSACSDAKRSGLYLFVSLETTNCSNESARSTISTMSATPGALSLPGARQGGTLTSTRASHVSQSVSIVSWHEQPLFLVAAPTYCFLSLCVPGVGSWSARWASCLLCGLCCDRSCYRFLDRVLYSLWSRYQCRRPQSHGLGH